MLVYRVAKEEEIKTLLNEESLENVGRECVVNSKLNNHNYLSGKRYLHFYPDYGSIFYTNSGDNRYICTYDIPDDVLEPHKGIGYYLDREYYERLEEVTEYAVEVEYLSFSNLKKVEMMTDLVLFEDYCYGDYGDYIQTIYEQGTQKVLKKIE